MPASQEGGEAFDEETSAEGAYGHGLLVGNLYAVRGVDNDAAGHGRLDL